MAQKWETSERGNFLNKMKKISKKGFGFCPISEQTYERIFFHMFPVTSKQNFDNLICIH